MARNKLLAVMLCVVMLSGCAAMHSKKYWAETAAVAAIRVADAESTVAALKRCSACSEQNPIFSNRPSRAEFYWKGALITAAERLVIAWIWKKDKTVGSVLSSFDAALNLTYHGFAIHGNLRQPGDPPTCPSGTTCNLP